MIGQGQGEICRASCCCGYGTVGGAPRPNSHDAQAVLDRWGFVNGYFRADHSRVCSLVVALLLHGSDVVQRVVSALVRDGAVPEASLTTNGSNGHH
jgi:hypothetical protein